MTPFASYALDVETHKTINEKIPQNTLNGFSLDLYTKNQLGLLNGVKEQFVNSNNKLEMWKWIRDGGKYEDKPNGTIPYRRSANHFHNPLKPLDKAGFTGMLDIPFAFSGESAILWSQEPKGKQYVGGHYSWHDVRDYYYKSLTGEELNTRNTNYADTFRGLGQLMHLVQDMSVPEHARNDGHYSDAYEEWVRDIPSSNNPLWENMWNIALANPIFFDKETLATPSKFSSAPVPIANLFDTEQYAGNNPDITVAQPDKIGLSEYTSANFVSSDTMFTKEFPYPSMKTSVTATDKDIDDPVFKGSTVKRQYYQKTSDGDTGYLLAGVGYLELYLSTVISDPDTVPSPYAVIPPMDNYIYYDYAQRLLPRAVGYSSGLLEYFFRGKINLELYAADPSEYVITNDTDENMYGKFQLYYDDAKDNKRKLLYDLKEMPIIAHGRSVPFVLDDPSAANNPGTYTLVFKGKMGNEEGAVVGRVVKFAPLTISAPDRCLYGLADGARLPQQFNKIKAKVTSSFTPEQAVQSGTLWAIAKYKRRMDYQPDLSTDPPSPGVIDPVFAYSTSAPIPITAADLAAMNSTKEFIFNFAGSPIPAGITDLYLKVVFRGATGTPQDLIAMGWKDLGEPMHHVYWNATDAFYIEGKMYDKNTIESDIFLLDKAQKSGFPYGPLELDTDIAYCPDLDGVSKTHVEYKALKAGTFGRVITITEADQPEFDVIIHRKSTNPYEEIASLLTSPAVVNQTNQNGVLQIFPVFTFRGSSLHAGSLFVHCAGACPENILTLPWPNPPLSMTPKPADFIAQ
jgi:hypothetical protein